MTSPGPKPALQWLAVASCAVDPSYQRSIESDRSKRLIEKIAADFRWSAFQAVLATRAPGGKYLILDGQHRVEAARRRGLAEVPAVVVAADSVAEQAAAFVQANLDRVSINQFALFHARLVAGEERAAEIGRACRAAGIAIPKYPIPADKLAPGQTLALATIGKLVAALGHRPAVAVLSAVTAAYGGHPGALRAALLLAARTLYEEAPSESARQDALRRLTRWLERQAPADLFAKAMRRKSARGGTEAANIAALAKAGMRDASAAPPRDMGSIRAPTRAELMGRR